MKTLVWVIGAGGMLGRAVVRAARTTPTWEVLTPPKLDWADDDVLAEQIVSTTRELLATSAAEGMRWSIVWAAGAAVTSATDDELESELETFHRSMRSIAQEVRGYGQLGTLFVASSVGGVYGAAVNPPFTESSAPAARSPYGRFKLEVESVARELGDAGLSVLIGRITNLYGPGQRLEKMQGLISHLALARLGGNAVSIFVPLETKRDYIYVDDCARLILAALDRLGRSAEPHVVTKILGSGNGTSISALLGYAQSLGKRPLRIVLGSSPAAAQQAPDLRTSSIVWPELDRFEKTTIPAGFQSTTIDILRTLQDRQAK